MVIKLIIIVESVLILGLMLRCIVEKILIGRVVVFGLVVKLVMIRLLSDRVNVKSQLEIIVGKILGNVIDKKLLSGFVLRLVVVFFRFWLNDINWDEIMILIQYIVNVVWVKMIVVMFIWLNIVLNSSNSERFKIILGIISGVQVIFVNNVWLQNLFLWISVQVVIVFKIVVSVVVIVVICRVI